MAQKIILITGISSGIGKISSLTLAQNGYKVYGLGRKEIDFAHENIHFLQCDVTNKPNISSVINFIMEKENHIDVLINNAGAGIVGALDLSTKEDFDFQIRVNLEGVVNMCSAVIPIFRKQRSGMVINVSSIGGIMGLPFQGLYSASKFAVEGYSEALRLELYPFNIKVKLIEPGDFNTGFTSHRIRSEQTLQNADYQTQFEKTLKIIENNENSGSNPQRIANLLVKIIKSNSNKFRYPIGNTIEILSIYAKRFLPGRAYQSILRTFYQIKKNPN